MKKNSFGLAPMRPLTMSVQERVNLERTNELYPPDRPFLSLGSELDALKKKPKLTPKKRAKRP